MLHILTSLLTKKNIQFYNLNIYQLLANPKSNNNILDLNQPQIITTSSRYSIATQDTSNISNTSQLSLASKTQQLKNESKYTQKIITKPTLDRKQNTSTKKLRSKVHLDTKHEVNHKIYDDDLNNHQAYQTQHKKDNSKNRKKSNKTLKSDRQINQYSSSDINDTAAITKQAEKVVQITNAMTISEMSGLLKIVETELIKTLFLQGICVTMNQKIDCATAKSLAEHYGFSLLEEKSSIQLPLIENKTVIDKDHDDIKYKRPIVAVLGHPGHGKTTLINAICGRENQDLTLEGFLTNLNIHEVTITSSNNHEDNQAVILDTPTHKAFNNMRRRCISIADIGIIVIAAHEGIQELTIEAIRNCQDYQLPFLIVLTNIDRDNIDTDKIKQELGNLEIILKEWGGNTAIIEVNSLEAKNLPTLSSQILELSQKSTPEVPHTGPASGRVLDIHLDKYTGYVITVVIDSGKLQTGDHILIHNSTSKIRTIKDITNKKINYAGPSTIVQLWGLNSVLLTDSNFITNKDEKVLKQLTSSNKKTFDTGYGIANSSIPYAIDPLNHKEINLVLKADTLSFIEAITTQINNLSQQKVKINLITCGIGSITTTDIQLATISKAQILGFNTTLNTKIKQTADQNQIKIQIFDNLEMLNTYVETCMLDMVEIEYTEEILGHAIVENIFILSKGSVAGCFVKSGKLIQSSLIKVYRDDQIIYQGHLDSLKQIKDDVQEVYANQECGVLSRNFDLWKKNDEIRSYALFPKTKTL